jgi:hypothetical protein
MNINKESLEWNNLIQTNELHKKQNSIKNKLIEILIKWYYINESNSKKLQSINDVIKYMKELIQNWLLEKETYVDYLIKAWAIKLWEYLIYKWLINKEQLNNALKIQKEDNKYLWEILTEKEIVDFKDLALALEEFWVIKLWEYFVSQNIINISQLNMFIKVQKYKKIPLWKILVDFKIIKQNELIEILEKLWISQKHDDFISDEDQELDYYKLKES